MEKIEKAEFYRITPSEKAELNRKLTTARTSLLLKYPFYGCLLMHLKSGLVNCGTACTDMQNILWDPAFLKRLSMTEVSFVLQHEVLHTVLSHPLRANGKIQLLYNIAADIVVNATILRELGMDEFEVDGEKVIWQTPNNEPGDFYNTEQIYTMLVERYGEEVQDLYQAYVTTRGNVDNHESWKHSLSNPSFLEEQWQVYVDEAIKTSGILNMPSCIREYLEHVIYNSKVDWKMVLADFIQAVADRYDYTFHPSDRRFSESDFVLPGFGEVEGERVENLWFVVDTSGSIDDETLTKIYKEIEACIEQFTSVSGKLSFFDTAVSEPVEFDDAETLKKIVPKGGGGTSFRNIFRYLKEEMMDNLPVGIVILTDGYAEFPDETETMGVPVLWIITDNEEDAPFGRTVHIEM